MYVANGLALIAKSIQDFYYQKKEEINSNDSIQNYRLQINEPDFYQFHHLEAQLHLALEM